MLRDLLSSFAIQAGLVFFLLVVGGSLFYSWHVRRITEVELERSDVLLQQRGNKNEMHTAADTIDTSPVGVAPRKRSMKTDDSEVLRINKTERINLTDASLPTAFVSGQEPAEDVPVSPFGFGAYPELPEGWPADTFPAPSVEGELLRRVRIKLLSEGIHTTGANMEDGWVYPAIKGTVYVKWKEYENPNGTVRYISDIITSGEDGRRLHAIRMKKGKSLTVQDIPSDIRLISFEEGRIDPYTFLDLPLQ